MENKMTGTARNKPKTGARIPKPAIQKAIAISSSAAPIATSPTFSNLQYKRFIFYLFSLFSRLTSKN